MNNKGTNEGTEQEIKFVQRLNKNKDLSCWNDMGIIAKNHYAIRVIYKKYGELNGLKILPKADAFIAKGSIDNNYLKLKKYYLDEDDIERFDLKPVALSGISIKRPDSKKYQIMKMSPSTFYKVFKSNILASGSSIYCNKENEFNKNMDVIKAWGISLNEFLSYFNSKLNINLHSIVDPINKGNLKKIKLYSNDRIAKKINNNQKISNFIFFGIGNFEEPFTASWIYVHGKFQKNYTMPFSITTGSGRSKGVYTIVLKPKL